MPVLCDMSWKVLYIEEICYINTRIENCSKKSTRIRKKTLK